MGRSSNTIMSTQSVQTFGKKKTATAVAHGKNGKGLIKINGSPITLVQPEILRFKVYEPLTLVGLDKFQNIDIRVKVTGGGHISQVYAIRQAIAKGLVAYHQKFVDEASKNELKKIFASYDKTLSVADSRRMEPKKFGGRGARARFLLTHCLSNYLCRHHIIRKVHQSSLICKILHSSFFYIHVLLGLYDILLVY